MTSPQTMSFQDLLISHIMPFVNDPLILMNIALSCKLAYLHMKRLPLHHALFLQDASIEILEDIPLPISRAISILVYKRCEIRSCRAPAYCRKKLLKNHDGFLSIFLCEDHINRALVHGGNTVFLPISQLAYAINEDAFTPRSVFPTITDQAVMNHGRAMLNKWILPNNRNFTYCLAQTQGDLFHPLDTFAGVVAVLPTTSVEEISNFARAFSSGAPEALAIFNDRINRDNAIREAKVRVEQRKRREEIRKLPFETALTQRVEMLDAMLTLLHMPVSAELIENFGSEFLNRHLQDPDYFNIVRCEDAKLDFFKPQSLSLQPIGYQGWDKRVATVLCEGLFAHHQHLVQHSVIDANTMANHLFVKELESDVQWSIIDELRVMGGGNYKKVPTPLINSEVKDILNLLQLSFQDGKLKIIDFNDKEHVANVCVKAFQHWLDDLENFKTMLQSELPPCEGWSWDTIDWKTVQVRTHVHEIYSCPNFFYVPKSYIMMKDGTMEFNDDISMEQRTTMMKKAVMSVRYAIANLLL